MSNTPTKSYPWVTFAAIVGGLALFALIVVIAYLPQRSETVQQGTLTPAERKTRLNEMRAKELKQSGSYAWLDQQKGQVQLPIDRAVELTIQELNAKK